jgi:hypothetical protein
MPSKDLIVRPSQATLVELAARAVRTHNLPIHTLSTRMQAQVAAADDRVFITKVLNSSRNLVVHAGSTFGDLARAVKAKTFERRKNGVVVDSKVSSDSIVVVWIRKCVACVLPNYVIYPAEEFITEDITKLIVFLLETNRIKPGLDDRMNMIRENAYRKVPLCFECVEDGNEHDVYDPIDTNVGFDDSSMFILMSDVVESFGY